MASMATVTNTATMIDNTSINNISFCPTPDKVNSLIEQSNYAEQVRQFLVSRTDDDWRKSDEFASDGFVFSPKVLSKLYHLPGKFGLCPDSLHPDDTILAKLGRGATDRGIGPGGLGDGDFKVINDRNMPLGSTSCGPNGVLANTQGRINLFHEDIKNTTEFLYQYISFRDENLNAIFKMFVDKISLSAKTMRLDPNKEETLREDLQEHYSNVCDMFVLIADNDKINLSDRGIGCVSFCQTWLRNGSEVGNAQFSVMSPHFQTRFHVTDDDALKSCGVTQTQINSYVTIIKHFDSIMSQDYGLGGGGQAFINLDNLLKQLNSHQIRAVEVRPKKRKLDGQAAAAANTGGGFKRQGGRYSRNSRVKNKNTKRNKKNTKRNKKNKSKKRTHKK